MKRAPDVNFMIEGNVFIGAQLGADFTAEHEWGIKELWDLFGIKSYPTMAEGPIGMKRFEATQVPKNWFGPASDLENKREYKNAQVLIVDDYWDDEPHFSRELFLYEKSKSPNMAGAWDGGSFAILVKEDENIEYLKQLHQAILNKNVAVWIGGGPENPFARPPLNIFINDRIPEGGRTSMHDACMAQRQLIFDSRKTGVEEKLKKAGKKWHSLRADYNLKESGKLMREATNYPVIYWLNPTEQSKNNYGWFTVEELEQWIENKGPIPKNNEKVC